jgi:RimJ/RimL family protein N-acetyltransferase
VAPLSTPRLVLRQWRESDLAPFAELNADAEVMRYFPATLSRAQSDAFAERVRLTLGEQGWGLWAVELPDAAQFVGFVGLNRASFEAHFTPAVEVGWRLARRYWGHGYATEAARAALQFGFGELTLDQIVSFSATINQPSIRVMQRLGMTSDPSEDFDHPAVADGPLRRHVLYRMSAHAWSG